MFFILLRARIFCYKIGKKNKIDVREDREVKHNELGLRSQVRLENLKHRKDYSLTAFANSMKKNLQKDNFRKVFRSSEFEAELRVFKEFQQLSKVVEVTKVETSDNEMDEELESPPKTSQV